jgi:hypothetical protein
VMRDEPPAPDPRGPAGAHARRGGRTLDALLTPVRSGGPLTSRSTAIRTRSRRRDDRRPARAARHRPARRRRRSELRRDQARQYASPRSRHGAIRSRSSISSGGG